MAEDNKLVILMRSYIRHPADIPVKIVPVTGRMLPEHKLKNISEGGVAFFSAEAVEVGSILTMSIDLVKPPFMAEGVVMWCRASKQYYAVGVRFTNPDDMFLARMVEQVCHIEHYRREVLNREGRQLSPQQAAAEWIAEYAEDFPNPQ